MSWQAIKGKSISSRPAKEEIKRQGQVGLRCDIPPHADLLEGVSMNVMSRRHSRSLKRDLIYRRNSSLKFAHQVHERFMRIGLAAFEVDWMKDLSSRFKRHMKQNSNLSDRSGNSDHRVLWSLTLFMNGKKFYCWQGELWAIKYKIIIIS